MEIWHFGGKYMDTSEMKAILDEDFVRLLKRLQVYDAVNEGTAICDFCQDAVSVENISMVFPNNGKVCFCCTKKECTDLLLKHRGICE